MQGWAPLAAWLSKATAIIEPLTGTKATVMEPEHINAIGNTLQGLKERTAQLRRYL